jgi:hypothetical protein
MKRKSIFVLAMMAIILSVFMVGCSGQDKPTPRLIEPVTTLTTDGGFGFIGGYFEHYRDSLTSDHEAVSFDDYSIITIDRCVTINTFTTKMELFYAPGKSWKDKGEGRWCLE